MSTSRRLGLVIACTMAAAAAAGCSTRGDATDDPNPPDGFRELADVRFDVPGTTAEDDLP